MLLVQIVLTTLTVMCTLCVGGSPRRGTTVEKFVGLDVPLTATLLDDQMKAAINGKCIIQFNPIEKIHCDGRVYSRTSEFLEVQNPDPLMYWILCLDTKGGIFEQVKRT